MGTGLIRSEDNLALTLLREVEEEAVRGRNKEVIVRCPVSVANFLMNQKREHIAQLEARYGVSIQIEASVHMISPEYDIEKLKVATRRVHDAVEAVVSMDSTSVEVSDETRDTDEDASTSSAAEGDDAKEDAPKKRSRRRRRRNKVTQMKRNKTHRTPVKIRLVMRTRATPTSKMAQMQARDQTQEQKNRPRLKMRKRTVQKRQSPSAHPANAPHVKRQRLM